MSEWPEFTFPEELRIGIWSHGIGEHVVVPLGRPAMVEDTRCSTDPRAAHPRGPPGSSPEAAMRRRSRPLHVHIILPFLIACAALVKPVAAQHCWPGSVALLVRDERGALIHPGELTSYTSTPQPGLVGPGAPDP